MDLVLGLGGEFGSIKAVGVGLMGKQRANKKQHGQDSEVEVLQVLYQGALVGRGKKCMDWTLRSLHPPLGTALYKPAREAWLSRLAVSLHLLE